MGDPGALKRLERQLTRVALREIARMRQITKAADAAVKRARPWPAKRLGAITGNTQDRLGVLYSPPIAAEIRREKSRRALMVAEQERPEQFKQRIEQIKKEEWLAHGNALTDAEARARAMQYRAFDHMVEGEELRILQERGLAGAPVQLDRANSGSWSPDPDQAVRAIIPDKPGVYVFAVDYAGIGSPSNDVHILTVEKRADGSANILAGGSFTTTQSPGIQEALSPPAVVLSSPSSGSRSILVYPLNPAPAGGKR